MSDRGGKGYEAKKKLEKTMAEMLINFANGVSLQIQEVEFPNKINPKMSI